MQAHSPLRDNILSQLREIVVTQLSSEKVRVYLFGSWARQEEKQSSDIDIAIEIERPIDSTKWNDFIEKIEESTIPYRVDVVDLRHASPQLVEKVKEEGILWKDCVND
ncbi:nucleotidyltransferase family protein [Salipaludibacillus sp. HK11]|uniref:nucleotidyltransferase family protein n=1 Tax=Salipaludibacillus sp. HK11 TaxID=3394320 RepID=UPI0039FCFF2E